MKKLNILVLHSMGPKESWFSGVSDVELMFPRYDENNNYIVHNCYVQIPSFVKEFSFDAILIMSTFMDKVAGQGLNSSFIKQFDFIKSSSALKIAFPQDDYWFSEVRDQFYVDYKIDRLYPVCPETTWHELIPNFIASGGDTRQGYTTYITPLMLLKAQKKKEWLCRKNDVIYRAKKTPAAPNRYGFIKGVIGDLFVSQINSCEGLNIDISSDPKKLIHGEGWIDFIANSRAILGSNSGSSVRLRNHDVYNSLLSYQRKNPNATWIEVEESVFDESDRGKEYTAISPRNIEAAMVGTVQILTPGSYSGFLKPFMDYLPLEEDCSNAARVIKSLKDESLCLKIAHSCFNSFINEPRLHVNTIINDVIELIKLNELNQKEEKKFLSLKKRYGLWEKYQSLLPRLLFLVKVNLLSILPKGFKNTIKSFLR